MMQGGNVGRGNRGGGKKPPGREKLQFSVCDVSSDEFKKTWLTLKELHDKELHRLQTKLTSLRKERLADGRRTGSIAKIKELTEQQKVLNSTIHDLRDQLNAKVCDRCSVNETYRNTLQQEFYDIQQQNVRFIAELTAERNNLREENKRLSAKLKLREQTHTESSFNTEEDFVPCSQRSPPVFPGRASIHGTQMFEPLKLMLESNRDQPKSKAEKEPQQRSEFPIPLCSQDLFEVPETPSEVPETPSEVPETPCEVPETPCEVPETSLETVSSHSSKHTIEGSANLKSSAGLHLRSTPGPQRGSGCQEASDSSEDRLGQPKRKHILTQKTSTEKILTEKCEMPMIFSWSFSSGTENPPTQIVSETSEENMPVNTTSLFSSFIERKEASPSSGLPFDSTVKRGGKRRSRAGAKHSPGVSLRDGSNQTPPTEQSAVKTTNESSGAGNGAEKPQGDTQSVTGSGIKRKAKRTCGL